MSENFKQMKIIAVKMYFPQYKYMTFMYSYHMSENDEQRREFNIQPQVT